MSNFKNIIKAQLFQLIELIDFNEIAINYSGPERATNRINFYQEITINVNASDHLIRVTGDVEVAPEKIIPTIDKAEVIYHYRFVLLEEREEIFNQELKPINEKLKQL